MPDLYELVKHHGSIRNYIVKLAIEHADGFVHEISTDARVNKRGFSADDMHRELLKVANDLSTANIATDEREKQARAKR